MTYLVALIGLVGYALAWRLYIDVTRLELVCKLTAVELDDVKEENLELKCKIKGITTPSEARKITEDQLANRWNH